MPNNHPPTLGNGKICYIDLPSRDVNESASFYRDVFGWNIRERTHGETSFDDGVGEVSGRWVPGRKPAADPGMIVYIMVDSVAETMRSIIAKGGTIVQDIGMDPPEITARFSDPTGNVFGLYQEPGA